MKTYKDWNWRLEAHTKDALAMGLKDTGLKIAGHTWVERRGNGSIVMRYKKADLLTYWPCGRIIVRMDSNTSGSIVRINNALRYVAYLLPVANKTYWNHNRLFTDGDEVGRDGGIKVQSRERW